MPVTHIRVITNCQTGQSYTETYETPDPTPEEILAASAAAAADVREAAKQARQKLVEAITVTVNGKVFDGNEVAQNRMTRAILSLQSTGQPSTSWALADNTVVVVTLAEFTEALSLAGAAQTAVWFI